MSEFDPDNPRDDEEAEAIRLMREAAVTIEGAIFKTIVAAEMESNEGVSARMTRVARQESRDAWLDVADKLMRFAMGD